MDRGALWAMVCSVAKSHTRLKLLHTNTHTHTHTHTRVRSSLHRSLKKYGYIDYMFKISLRNFPGSPVVKTLASDAAGCGFDP